LNCEGGKSNKREYMVEYSGKNEKDIYGAYMKTKRSTDKDII
jgi:hypothetical protein